MLINKILDLAAVRPKAQIVVAVNFPFVFLRHNDIFAFYFGRIHGLFIELLACFSHRLAAFSHIFTGNKIICPEESDTSIL